MLGVEQESDKGMRLEEQVHGSSAPGSLTRPSNRSSRSSGSAASKSSAIQYPWPFEQTGDARLGRLSRHQRNRPTAPRDDHLLAAVDLVDQAGQAGLGGVSDYFHDLIETVRNFKAR
jgi:hypothetical protein